VLRGGAEKGQIEWKVLIYDHRSRDTIAPLLRVGNLRTLGITLHMLLNTERQPIRDAPAVYFVQPTEENIRLIARDCRADLYAQYRINFSSPISRPLLELLAQELVAIPNVANVHVTDQFLNFVALEPDFFSLEQHNSYQTLHSPQALVSDQQMEAHIDAIVSGLASVLLQLQVLPVVVSVPGGAAQMVAEKVSAQLRDLLRERQLEPSVSQSRPVLLLCDRNSDIPVGLAHAWHYRSLLHDVHGMRLNRIELKDPDSSSSAPKVYELDRSDPFWAANAGELYPVVADRASEELERFKLAKEQVNATSDDPDAAMRNMSTIMSSAGQMKEQKKLVDMHTKLAFGLLQSIKGRQLDAYHHTEVALMNKDSYEKPKFEELLTTAGTDIDRLRLFLIYYYAMEELGPEEEKEVTQWEKKLAAQGIDMRPLAYLKNMRSFTRTSLGSGSQAVPATLSKTLLGFGTNFAEGIKKAKAQLESTFKSKDVVLLALTRMVDAILQDPTSAAARESRKKMTETLYCHDPKTGCKIDVAQFKFNHAIVFMVGGGNYVEYQNLKDWERLQPKGKAVVYGVTELFTAAEFLAQLSFLGAQ